MVIDTSALLAILLAEPDAEVYRIAMEEDPTRLIASGTLLETAMVIEARKGDAGGRELDRLVHRAGLTVVPSDADLIDEARRGHRRFGKGHHPAALNFGDLFAYALARLTDEPLLFKGNDFAQTDVRRVVCAPDATRGVERRQDA